MLCPYGFETDAQGCALCECKNPCRDVECPNGTECQVDDSGCTAGEPCSPSTNCRKARASLGECAFGDPLTGAGNRPLLCGTDSDKPSCPSGYECFVQQKAEYGLCCPQEQQNRAAECPQSVPADFRCDKKCEFDADCEVGMKCCDTSCGKACLSSRNSTICEQQRRLARLFSEGVDAPGYFPQCDEDGQFLAKQCSTNGKVCWCVNSAGQQMSGSMGPAAAVVCATKDRSSFARSSKLKEDSHDCSLVMCDVLCEYGYKKDDKGCTQCECVDPCESKTCEKDEECVIVKEEPCTGSVCAVSASCSKKSDPGLVCSSGEAQLKDNATVSCANAELCDEGFDCEILPGESMGVCCRRSQLAPKDAEREEEMPKDKVSTMCEYLRELGSRGEKLAVPTPNCTEDGKYSPVQCDAQGCFCVDDFGVEIQNSRKENQTANEVECRQMRSAKPCYNLLCRLGCEFGFEYDEEGCPICACRNPCKAASCGENEVCQLAEPSTACSNWWCPPVPKCISKKAAQRSMMMFCPGSYSGPFMNAETNEVVQCSADSREDSCPSGYSCIPVGDDEEYGRCCPARENRENDDQWSETREQSDVKSGQCPYLIPFDTPMGAISCEIQCADDKRCSGDSKCCSNGCGTQCMPPVQMTGCEHTRTLREHQTHAGETRSQNPPIPSCDPMGRGFEDVQCHGESCWCADDAGIEIPGTRVNGAPTLNCTAVREQGRNVNTTCNVECNVDCEFGQKLDAKGCPYMCECVDPCAELNCAMNEECRLVPLSCVGKGPCPRQAMCRPKIENVCLVGEPLLLNETLITCGPGENVCPTSHKCQLDIFGEFAHCCPKPREVCFGPPPMCARVNHEVEIEERWFYDEMTRQCQPFPFNKDHCQGALNLFSSQSECEGICPTRTECEAMREIKSNEQSASAETATAKPVYVPNCDYRLGTWDPVQCMPELGLCWCVDQQGNQISGSMVRGTPNCSELRSEGDKIPPPAICPNGEPVHICDYREVCSRNCAAQNNATCRVDPCGGCKAVFYDESNNVVDCKKGLTACQEESQMVRNSRAWNNQFFHTISSLIQRVYPDNLPGFPGGNERSNRAKREAPSDEISDYDDPAARAMSAYHQNRRRQSQEPIAELSAPPKVVVPLRAPIIMIVHRRIHQTPNPLEIMQTLSSAMPRMRMMVQVADEPKEEEIVSQESVNPIDPALFMSHVTAMMERMMGGQQVPQLAPQLPEPMMPQPQASERFVVGPNFAEVRMTMKSDGPVPLAAMRQVEQGSLNHLLNYLFGHPADARESRIVEKTVTVSQDDCPPAGIADAISAMIGGCRNECSDHSDCSGNEKCCRYGCSSSCTAPVAREAPSDKTKPGHCPFPTLNPQCLLSEQTDQCMHDSHCPGAAKCCPGFCGSVCRAPVEENAEESMPLSMYVAPPVCSADGGYAVSQSQGPLSWCVDRYGVPIDSTLTKGSVACDVNGNITKREAVGDVCPKGVEARVCRDECVSAVCHSHPFAMCVADPCNNCEIHFVDALGDKVDCSPVCEQDSHQSSACEENSGIRSRKRYTFNQTSQRCEEFQYDCNGNDNNFESADECEKTCKKPKSVCDLPREPGLCKAKFPAWYYNAMTHQCEEFSYGGCGGNANNFESKEACDQTCPDMVLCPYDTITKEGLTREPCDRIAACAASACPGSPNAVCRVDPCECRATWIDPELDEPARCEKEFDLVAKANEVEPKCSSLQKKNALIGNIYVPECASDGSFHPLQCISLPSKKECWCVDSAGHQIGEPFTDKSKTCGPIKISRVDVDMAFKNPKFESADKMYLSMKLERFLRSTDAKADDLRVLSPEKKDDMVRAKFSLTNDNCAALAYKIEQLVMAKSFKIGDNVADFSNSNFTYVVEEKSDSKNAQGVGKVEVIYSADKNEVLAIKRLLEPRAVDARTTTLAAAVLAVTVVVCILLLMTILMHRKQAALKKMAVVGAGDAPGTMAFQNPVYVLWTNRVMSAVCRRSPAPSPPKSPDDLARMEAQNENGIEDIDDVDDEFNNPNYDDVIDEHSVKCPKM
ncbi:uncharacterized protein LOC100903276 [Galendromus occidentalis]|uniref:Uncharacterized protein LOC100903276 n=1 Tax=Galendromus occidentalis TaxID=34638 RepID=A0AAJ7L607_9ACAR|nr:uncharacterized protein LOC100903276 [Galendromus occidentalis]